MLIYLPGIDEYPLKSDYVPIALKTMRSANIPHTDLRPCLSQEPVSRYFMPPGQGQHYSPEGNRQVAGCVRDAIIPFLSQRKDVTIHPADAIAP
jgi:hypothetical protein